MLVDAIYVQRGLFSTFVWEPVNSLEFCDSSEKLRSYNLSLDAVVCASTHFVPICEDVSNSILQISYIQQEKVTLCADGRFPPTAFFSKSKITVTPTEILEDFRFSLNSFKITFLSFPVQGLLHNFQLHLIQLLLTSSFHSWSTLHSLPVVLRNLQRMS